MGRKIIISESQLKRLAKSITEAVSGYDDIFVMHKHAGHSMRLLADTGNDLMRVLKGLMGMIIDDDFSFVDVKENLEAANDTIDEIINIMEVVFNDFSEKSLIEKGQYLIKKLRKFKNRTKLLMSHEEGMLNQEDVIDKLKELIKELASDYKSFVEQFYQTNEKFRKIMDKLGPHARPEDN